MSPFQKMIVTLVCLGFVISSIRGFVKNSRELYRLTSEIKKRAIQIAVGIMYEARSPERQRWTSAGTIEFALPLYWTDDAKMVTTLDIWARIVIKRESRHALLCGLLGFSHLVTSILIAMVLRKRGWKVGISVTDPKPNHEELGLTGWHTIKRRKS